MPHNRNVSYHQDFRPFTPFRVTIGKHCKVALGRPGIAQLRNTGKPTQRPSAWYNPTIQRKTARTAETNRRRFGRGAGRPVTQPQFPFPPEYFGREDEQDDTLFYVQPRLVVHIDDGAIAAVGAAFRSLIPPDAVVLDLMSSWRSHWPAGHPKSRLVGLGMNAVEMAENPDLDEYVVQDINRNPELPFTDAAFDAAVITVSVQYLTSPIAVFQQVHRILKPGGVFIVTFSNRMFPTKAVRIWRATSDRGHLDLVAAYMEAAEFADIRGGLTNSESSPPDDPLFLVAGVKATDPELLSE